MLLPEFMAEDHRESGRPAASLFVSAGERPADLRFDSEHVKEFAADFLPAQTRRAFLGTQRERSIPINGDAGKRPVLVPKIEEVRIGHRVEDRLVFRSQVGHAKSDELVRFWEWQRF